MTEEFSNFLGTILHQNSQQNTLLHEVSNQYVPKTGRLFPLENDNTRTHDSFPLQYKAKIRSTSIGMDKSMEYSFFLYKTILGQASLARPKCYIIG